MNVSCPRIRIQICQIQYQSGRGSNSQPFDHAQNRSVGQTVLRCKQSNRHGVDLAALQQLRCVVRVTASTCWHELRPCRNECRITSALAAGWFEIELRLTGTFARAPFAALNSWKRRHVCPQEISKKFCRGVSWNLLHGLRPDASVWGGESIEQNTNRRINQLGGRRVRTIDIHAHCYVDLQDLIQGHPEALIPTAALQRLTARFSVRQKMWTRAFATWTSMASTSVPSCSRPRVQLLGGPRSCRQDRRAPE